LHGFAFLLPQSVLEHVEPGVVVVEPVVVDDLGVEVVVDDLGVEVVVDDLGVEVVVDDLGVEVVVDDLGVEVVVDDDDDEEEEIAKGVHCEGLVHTEPAFEHPVEQCSILVPLQVQVVVYPNSQLQKSEIPPVVVCV
jgi:hypothetical protein